MNRQTVIAFFRQVAKTVNPIADYVEEPTVYIVPYRHFYRATRSDYFSIATKPFGRVHRDSSYHVFAYVRLHF